MSASDDSFGSAVGCVFGIFVALIVIGVLCFVFLGGSVYVLSNVTCSACGLSGRCQQCAGSGNGMLWGKCDACKGSGKCPKCR